MSELVLVILLLAGVGLFVGGFFAGMKLSPPKIEVKEVKVPHVVEVPMKTKETGGRVAYDPSDLHVRESQNMQKIQSIMRDAEFE